MVRYNAIDSKRIFSRLVRLCAASKNFFCLCRCSSSCSDSSKQLVVSRLFFRSLPVICGYNFLQKVCVIFDTFFSSYTKIGPLFQLATEWYFWRRRWNGINVRNSTKRFVFFFHSSNPYFPILDLPS